MLISQHRWAEPSESRIWYWRTKSASTHTIRARAQQHTERCRCYDFASIVKYSFIMLSYATQNMYDSSTTHIFRTHPASAMCCRTIWYAKCCCWCRITHSMWDPSSGNANAYTFTSEHTVTHQYDVWQVKIAVQTQMRVVRMHMRWHTQTQTHKLQCTIRVRTLNSHSKHLTHSARQEERLRRRQQRRRNALEYNWSRNI